MTHNTDSAIDPERAAGVALKPREHDGARSTTQKSATAPGAVLARKMDSQITCNGGADSGGAVRCTDWLRRIVCGDNTEVLSGFPADCVDLVVTSPPYDDLRTYGGHSWNFETLAAQLVRVLEAERLGSVTANPRS